MLLCTSASYILLPLFLYSTSVQKLQLCELHLQLSLDASKHTSFVHPATSYKLTTSSYKTSRLELKSTPTAPDENSTEGEQEYINLCTPTQTYRVRQVQSSNSIHVLRPSQGLHGNPTSDGADNNENEEELGLAESVTSIAKCSSTLELHMPREEFSAIPFLLKVLKVYNRLSSDGDVPVHADMDVDVGMGMGDSETLPSGKNGRGGRSIKDRIFADIPVSQAQCEKAWNHLCAFIYDNASRGHQEGPCWRPAPLVKLDVWKRMVEGAVLQDINLEKQFLVDDLWKALLDDDGIAEPEKGPFPRDLFDAVIRRVCESDQQGFDSGRKCEFYLPFLCFCRKNMVY